MSSKQKVSHSFVANFEDRDPISLEPICDLPTSEVFFVKTMNGKVHAYDAIAWLPWLADGNRKDPITNQSLTNNEIHECFHACHALDPDDPVVQRCLDLTVKMRDLMVVPTSPLLNIVILKVQEGTYSSFTKEVEVVYNLVNSLTHEQYVTNQKLVVQMPKDAYLSLGF